MTHTVEIIDDAEYVRVVFAGEVTREEHESGRYDAIRALTSNGWSRLLVDVRQIDAKMSLSDDFEFTDEHQSTPIHYARTAVVYRAEESERFSFIENVAVNRGEDMKVFTDPEEAISWLTAK